MRACFLGQNVCALGFGVATLQTPPMMTEPADVTSDIIPDVTQIRSEIDLSTGFGAAVPLPERAADFVPFRPLA